MVTSGPLGNTQPVLSALPLPALRCLGKSAAGARATSKIIQFSCFLSFLELFSSESRCVRCQEAEFGF